MGKTEKNIIGKFVDLFKDEYFWYEDRKNAKAEIFYTDNVEEVTGYTKEELLAMPGKGKDIICGEDLQYLNQLVNEFKNGPDNNCLEIEFRITRKDKKNVWVKERFPLYQVIGTENGYETLGIIISHMPSLIVTDHEIPLMNGLQLIQSIRSDDKQLNIPVIEILKIGSDEIKKSYDEYGIKTILDDSSGFDQLDEQLRTILK